MAKYLYEIVATNKIKTIILKKVGIIFYILNKFRENKRDLTGQLLLQGLIFRKVINTEMLLFS